MRSLGNNELGLSGVRRGSGDRAACRGVRRKCAGNITQSALDGVDRQFPRNEDCEINPTTLWARLRPRSGSVRASGASELSSTCAFPGSMGLRDTWQHLAGQAPIFNGKDVAAFAEVVPGDLKLVF